MIITYYHCNCELHCGSVPEPFFFIEFECKCCKGICSLKLSIGMSSLIPNRLVQMSSEGYWGFIFNYFPVLRAGGFGFSCRFRVNF